MEDNSDIAFLAAATERDMRNRMIGSQGMRYNRTDFRQFLGPNGGQQVPQQQGPSPQHYHPNNYPPQQYQPPPQQYQQNNQPVYPSIPDGILPPSNAALLPMPTGYADPTVQASNNFNPAFQTTLEGVNQFNVPAYDKTYLADEQEFRDALIKEMKSQKTAIKKLNTDLKEIKVLVQTIIQSINHQSPPSEPFLDEDTVKS